MTAETSLTSKPFLLKRDIFDKCFHDLHLVSDKQVQLRVEVEALEVNFLEGQESDDDLFPNKLASSHRIEAQ